MVTDGGWTPVVKVAARTLRKRLEAVWRELGAACRTRHEPERVHQLRVATRRTLATLTAFRESGSRNGCDGFAGRRAAPAISTC